MKYFSSVTVRTLIVLFVVASMLFAVSMLPNLFKSNAENRVEATDDSADNGLPNFDIRISPSDAGDGSLASFRGSVGRDASAVSAIRQEIARGEENLRASLPEVVVEYDGRLGIPEVISPSVWKDREQRLSEPGRGHRPEVLKGFLKDNSPLVGLDPVQTDHLKISADYTNPDGNLSFTHLEQTIHGVPVFAGEVKAGFARDGSMVRVINNLAPGLDYA